MGGLFHQLRHPRRCYVVCTIPRSGSNLLTDGLRDTRRAGMPKQFFLPKDECRYAAGDAADETSLPCALDVEIAHVQRVIFDKLSARLDDIAHQNRKHFV